MRRLSNKEHKKEDKTNKSLRQAIVSFKYIGAILNGLNQRHATAEKKFLHFYIQVLYQIWQWRMLFCC